MQCAPVVARVFALRQAFAGFASGLFLRCCDEGRVDDATKYDGASRSVGRACGKSFACSDALDRE
jgi:hypothetical protein